MNASDLLQLICYVLLLTLLSFPLGNYMADVYEEKSTCLTRLFDPFAKSLFKICSISADTQMTWKTYTFAFLVFNGVGLFFVYLLQRMQEFLPLNPEKLANVSPDSSFNTAVSFASNTNWQGYSGELTMSYLTQILGLTVQNFLSAAAGMAVLIALIRGFRGAETGTIGNFWSDLVRSVTHILLPISALLTIALVSQGAVQTFNQYVTYTPLESLSTDSVPAAPASVSGAESSATPVRKIALGPAASQIAIKQLGTNGGGFFNVNSAHPFENPSPLSNLLEMLAILIIPAALCWTFGAMVKNRWQGFSLFAAMMIIFLGALSSCYLAEYCGNTAVAHAIADLPPFNMEGKEVRFGVVNSAIWAVATTCASNGSVNTMHDSLTPLGGMVPMILMQLGEVVFGGVGSGLYGMIIFAVITVFVAGLMVGRTPEYLGKKIEAFEMKMASLVILIPPIVVLAGTAIAVMMADGKAGVFNPGAHGFSEILYAFSSAGNNNGSAFAGLSANTPFYNTALGLAMFFARYWLAIPVLAMAGSLARKKSVPPGAGTMPTDNALFVVLLIGVVIIFGALTFIPALALGPIVEQLQMAVR